jgi:phosphatidylserine/phosphatidylglycerophosphate/cardiolipin synthase-like enzyme
LIPIYSKGKFFDFLQLHAFAASNCTSISASIPYASQGIASEEFYEEIRKSQKPACTFFRIDWSIPFDTRLIKNYSSDSIAFRGIHENLHAKVIWWKGYGVYIGSCNLTDRACFENFEMGVFISENDNAMEMLTSDLIIFFNELEKNSIAAGEKLIEILDLQNEILAPFREFRKSLMDKFQEKIEQLSSSS